MGLFDNVKAGLDTAKEKAADLAREHGDKVQDGIDKAAHLVDERTKGKYSDKIHTGTDKAKEAVERLAHQDDPKPGDGGAQTPPKA